MEQPNEEAKKIEKFMVKKLLPKINRILAEHFTKDQIYENTKFYFGFLDPQDVDEALYQALLVIYGEQVLRNDFFSFIGLDLDVIALIFRSLNNLSIRRIFLVDKNLRKKELPIIEKVAAFRNELPSFRQYLKNHPYHLEYTAALQTMELVNLLDEQKYVTFKLIYSEREKGVYNHVLFVKNNHYVELLLELGGTDAAEIIGKSINRRFEDFGIDDITTDGKIYFLCPLQKFKEYKFIYENIIFELFVEHKCFLRLLEVNDVRAENTKHSYIECNFCNLENPLSKCSNCNATYCNKECQSSDWILNNHALKCEKKKINKKESVLK
jgi:hypothetical protein